MPSAFRLTGGERGVVRWGYQPAATLRQWRLDEHGSTITGRVEESHEYALEQSPLTFVVDAGAGQWRWPIRDLTIAGSTVTLTVGPRETR